MKINHLLLFVCLLLCYGCGSDAPKEAPVEEMQAVSSVEFNTYYWVNNTSGTAIKDQSKSNTLATIPYGAEVWVSDQSEGKWVYARAGSQQGWIEEKQISPNYIYPAGKFFINRQGEIHETAQTFQKIRPIDDYYLASYNEQFNKKSAVFSAEGQQYASHAGQLIGINEGIALYSTGGTHPLSSYITLEESKLLYENYGFAHPYSDGMAVITDRYTTKVIDRQGHEAFSLGKTYTKPQAFSAGLMKVEYIHGKGDEEQTVDQLIDTRGNWVLSSHIESIQFNANGCILGLYEGKQVKVDGNGEVLSDLSLVDKHLAVKGGYIDQSGLKSITLPDTILLHSNFQHGCALLLTPTLLQVIDYQGSILFEVAHEFEAIDKVMQGKRHSFQETAHLAIGWLKDDQAYLIRKIPSGKKAPVQVFILHPSGEVALRKEFPKIQELRTFKEGFVAMKMNVNRSQHFRKLTGHKINRNYTTPLWGFLDTLGNIAVKPEYLEVSNFNAGLAVVKPIQDYDKRTMKGINRYQQFINPQGTVVKDSVLRTGQSLAQDQTWYRHFDSPDTVRAIDSLGNALGQFLLANEVLHQFSNGHLLVATSEGKQYDIIGTDSSYVSSLGFDFIGNFSEGLAVVMRNGKYGYINSKGKVAIPLQFDYAGNFSEGMAVVGIGQFINVCDYPTQAQHHERNCNFLNGKFGYIDTQGKLAIDYHYAIARPFSNGRAVVGTGTIIMKEQQEALDSYLIPTFEGSYQYIDNQGATAFTQSFTIEPQAFKNGLAWVTVEGKKCYIDQLGKVVYPR